MMEFDGDFLRQLFGEVDDEVAERVGEHLLVVGGAALIFAGMPRGTEDVDVLSRLSSRSLLRAIDVVGERHELPHDWITTTSRESPFSIFPHASAAWCSQAGISKYSGRTCPTFSP